MISFIAENWVILLPPFFVLIVFVAVIVDSRLPKLIEYIKDEKGKITITIKQKRNGMFVVHDATNGRIIRFTRYVDIEAYILRRVNGWKL